MAVLKEDPREIRCGAADAWKISDFVLGRSRERESEREPVEVTATRSALPPAPRQRCGRNTSSRFRSGALGRAAEGLTMLDRMIDSDRSLAPETYGACRMRDGHRREYEPRQDGERVHFRERSERALADMSTTPGSCA